jgi:hypothetical protein
MGPGIRPAPRYSIAPGLALIQDVAAGWEAACPERNQARRVRLWVR